VVSKIEANLFEKNNFYFPLVLVVNFCLVLSENLFWGISPTRHENASNEIVFMFLRTL
jgi:hypothetical protein